MQTTAPLSGPTLELLYQRCVNTRAELAGNSRSNNSTTKEIDMPSTDMIEQYKVYLQDIGNIGTRHETARGFYISVLSALLTFLALAGKDGPLKEIDSSLVAVIGAGGIAICFLWLCHTLAFSAIYRAKFARVSAMEEHLPFKNFEAEYKALRADPAYLPLTYIECFITFVFGCLFLAAIILKC